MEFTWTDKEDEELFKNGKRIMLVTGKAKAIQKFVEALSYKIGYKCDWSFFAGRAHIDVPAEAYDKAAEAITDNKFMKQFISPFSMDSIANETYFEVLQMFMV